MNRQTVWHAVKQIGTVSARVWGIVFTVAAFAALAYLFSGEVAAAPAQQTIPQRTPTAAATAVPTVTPTSQSAPANTPAPTATSAPAGPTATSRPGAPTATHTPTAQPQHTNTATVPTTPTAVPAFSLQGQMAATSEMAAQGQEIEIQITIVNPGTEAAQNVAVRDEVPGALQIVSVSAEGGTATSQAGPNGTSIVLFAWPSLAPGSKTAATLVVRIAPNLANGSVIDNLAVAYADNAGAVTIGVSLGTPPQLLPTFD
jgi:uncharacterized repeat protein (TIGR01451 family)